MIWRVVVIILAGDIYKTNGSHGCINTPLEAAKTIYETVSVGTPVIVY